MKQVRINKATSGLVISTQGKAEGVLVTAEESEPSVKDCTGQSSTRGAPHSGGEACLKLLPLV